MLAAGAALPLAHIPGNPATARHDEADAKLAWSRTLAFLEKELG